MRLTVFGAKFGFSAFASGSFAVAVQHYHRRPWTKHSVTASSRFARVFTPIFAFSDSFENKRSGPRSQGGMHLVLSSFYGDDGLFLLESDWCF
jgi:hypothetical protein